MKYIIIGFVCILVYKFLSNLYYYHACKKLQLIYVDWINGEDNNCLYTKAKVLKLFKRAHIKDAIFCQTEHVGYGQIVSYNIQAMSNYPLHNEDHMNYTLRAYDEAIGYFRDEMFNTFNPIYWIDTIIFLPKNILEYIGADTEKVSSKILNVILTAIWWIITVLGVIYHDKIISAIQDFLDKL